MNPTFWLSETNAQQQAANERQLGYGASVEPSWVFADCENYLKDRVKVIEK